MSFRPPSSDQEKGLVLRAGAELAARLRLVADARDLSPRALAIDLLERGLEKEALRARAERALDALTPRERDVVWLTARGCTNQEIAEALVISSETVKTHVRNALGKFGVRSKADLRLLLLDLGIRWWET